MSASPPLLIEPSDFRVIVGEEAACSRNAAEALRALAKRVEATTVALIRESELCGDAEREAITSAVCAVECLVEIAEALERHADDLDDERPRRRTDREEHGLLLSEVL
jgi:hypothetical protein